MPNKKFLLINKPGGLTSHDVIGKLRGIIGEKKIGHSGTLDPFATGLLFIAIGRNSTRELSNYVGLDKEYVAVLKLGGVSDTYDRTGKISGGQRVEVTMDKIKEVLASFVGKQKQLPPMFSAKKVKGKRLYKLARQGIEIDRKPNDIEVYSIQGIDFDDQQNLLTFIVRCSSGTYIRGLAHDIGYMLGCGAYLQELVRTKIGDYKLEDAKNLDELSKSNWRDMVIGE